MRNVCKIAACLLLPIASCATAAEQYVPLVIEVTFANAPPVLDGKLDDACWQGLPEYTGLTDEDTKGVVSPATMVRICRDEKHIYVAFHALHPDPKRIPAKEKKRNGRSGTDDCVWVDIDASHSHRGFSHFVVNARGTQFEYLEGGSANKIQWRGDWQAAAKVVEDGYNVEMAIPFSLLKFNKNQDTFGICFERWLPKEHIWACWPDLKGVWDTARFADWKNVDPPWTKPRPAAMGYIASASGGGTDNDTKSGLDIKYPFASNMMGVMSVRPDFSNTEQVVESVDFSYNERYLPDYRPFFQEQSIGAPGCLFYSRRIEDFDLGTKLVGRRGQNSFGLMNARTMGDRSDTIFQYSRNIGDMSGIGTTLVDHWIPGHENLAALHTGWLGWKKGERKNSIGGGVYTSDTTGLPSGGYKDIHWDTWGGNGAIGANLRFAEIDPTYNPELGIKPDVDSRGCVGGLSWGKAYRKKKVRYMGASISRKRWDHYDGSPFISGNNFSGNINFNGGRGISFGIDQTKRNQLDDLGTLHKYDDFTPRIGLWWNGDSFDRDGGLNFSWGRRVGGRYSYVSFSQKFKLRDDLLLQTNYERTYLSAGIRRQLWWTLNYDLTSEKSIGGRMVNRLGKRNL